MPAGSAGPEPLGRLPGGPGEQPERRHVLGLYPLFFAEYGLGVAAIGVVNVVAALTLLSGLVVLSRMRETLGGGR